MSKSKKKKKVVKPKVSIDLKQHISKVRLFFRARKSIFLEKYKKISKTNKYEDIKKFFVMVTGYGFILNYSLHFIFGIKFNLFTLFAWGIAYYFINQEFVEWFRRLVFRR